MSVEQVVYVVIAISIAVVAVVGALMAWRAMSKAGAGLRAAEARLSLIAQTIPERMTATRAELAKVDAQTEHALWMLGNLDTRVDAARADLLAKRVASDRLRLRMIEGRLTVARLRQIVRLLVRLGELRRAIL